MRSTRLAAIACAALALGCENPAPSWYGNAGASGRASGGGSSGGASANATSSQGNTAAPAADSGDHTPATAASPTPASGGTGGSGGAAGMPAGAGAGSGGKTASATTGSAGHSGNSAGGSSESGSGSSAAVRGGSSGEQTVSPGTRTAPGFMNLAPPLGEPLDGKGKDLTPAAPSGWTWYEIAGAACRDGSPTGFYVHTGSADKLLIYLEGGGMCSNASFCSFNPASVNQVLSGDGQTVLGTAFGAISGRQQPGVYTQSDHMGSPKGIFDFTDTRNPLRDWSQIYVPYCTGDVHFGNKTNGTVPGLSNQQFVGYRNMKLFMSRIVPTFKAKISYVLLTGANAGGFGALLNLSMVQDAFGEVAVDALSDSGPPMDDQYMPVCMQKRWRDAWGFADSLPPDCDTCKQADGGGLLKLAEYLIRKHPSVRIGMWDPLESTCRHASLSIL